VKRFPIKILFNVWADANNTNAQSLNARDIALRLDPSRFESSMFVAREPDPRLLNRKNIRLIHLPHRLGSLVIAAHLIWGRHDILFYPPFNHLMDWYDALIWVGRRKKIIATAEGTADTLQVVPFRLRERLLRMVREADACYAISPYIAETMLRKFDLKMGVVPIGVNTGMFGPVDRSKHLLPAKVLFVGSIQPRKQIGLILDLAQEIGPQESEFHIIGNVIGAPAYRDSLLKRKVDDNLDHVHFHGKLLQSEVCEWMQRCDIFILPSRLEGTPKVVFEAAATGLPCIVFDDYRTPGVVDGVTGFQVKTFEDMMTRLKQLVEDRNLRMKMGAAAMEHVQQFDWDLIAKQWEDVFEKTITGRKLDSAQIHLSNTAYSSS
jgi:glycosyltransferase involved in cell wall biosynthesis